MKHIAIYIFSVLLILYSSTKQVVSAQKNKIIYSNEEIMNSEEYILGNRYSQYVKSISILGDSYSTFEGFIPSGNHCWYFSQPKEGVTDLKAVTQTWWHKLIKENGFKLEKNESFSGATICNTGYRKEDYSDRSFITRMKNLGSPDIIFICGATNDSWANSPIGEYQYENWTRDDLFKFRPAMSYLLSNMKDYYPNIEIYFILNDGLKSEINESVRQICSYYDIDLIELKEIHKLSGHPSIEGMSQICNQVKEYIFNK